MQLRITPWDTPTPPTKAALRQLLEDEGLTYYAWGNDPLDTYSAHTHPFNKIIYVAQGSITFHLPQTGQSLTLKTGERLDLPAGTPHSATVGIEGVECYEAHC